MSDNILPFDVQVEIMKRLPIKSLIQFRSVSKPWKSVIDSSKFIANYHRTQHHHHHHHLLVSFKTMEYERKYVSIVDDDTFPQQNLPVTVPSSVTLLNEPTIIGSSQGLVCFYDVPIAHPDDSGTKTAVIWNPTIRKSVTIPVSYVLGSPYTYITVLGFGVTPDTCDPKLVKVSFDSNYVNGGNRDIVVEVFSLSTQAWKRLTTNLPRNSTGFTYNQVVVDRFIYWRAWDMRFQELKQIMSFDMINEEFKELNLPDSFARDIRLFISKVRESLVVAQTKVVGEKEVVSVWMMEHGDPKSLTKKFNINTPNGLFEVRGFRKSGEPLIEMPKYDDDDDDAEPEPDDLFVYEPYSGHMKSVGITTKEFSWNVKSCIETLLLLDN